MRLKLGCCITHGGDTIKIGFIGPGKVGVSLAHYFTHKGIELTGFYGKTIKTTIEAANTTKSKFYNNLEDIINESDILFITTPDDIISIIDKKLSKFDLNNKSICHTSGSLSSTILSNAKNSGALIYSIHPIFAFSKKDTDLKELESIYFSIEGKVTDQYTDVIHLVRSLGNKFFIRGEQTSSLYHLANVFVSNLTLSLLDIGTSYLKELGLSEKDAIMAIYPLVQGNIKSISEKGFVKSLTGPVLRGDVVPITKHLSVLKEEHKELYKILSLNLLNLVSLKDNKNTKNLNDTQIEFINKNESVNVNKENAIKNLMNNSKKHAEIYKILGGLE
ncbi:Rossmann-like and DUF2520 domain-containing protein [Clostridium uliginosum]|uniref:Predicted oxidoreductase, contains short-chain dehydrogenase (SDR) and DUF2520 domains n=1 Tax=Clostridium uliginosum TaxID=119641 RepID=A0A1I1H899_9CLOT|nr:Rossmann-like and DUF2520 domain-containing protein [Clostridium uliginosum]SFC17673.1 Predicted oxidoreductase, contains short-chain dehydrogenase (SDR) and DUF2520 domains [Clostridium uliginosum]